MDDLLAKVRTPNRGFSPLAALFSGRAVPAALARIGLSLAAFSGKPLKFGRTVIAVRHADVMAVLRRDLDFLIAPVNAQRIGEVNGGDFILGMDRSPAQIKEREALYRALAVVDLSALAADIRNRARAKLDSVGAEFDVIADYARPIAVTTAQALFGVAPDDQALFAEVVRAIFHHTFLNLSNDKVIRDRALAAAPLMQAWITGEITRRRASGDLGRDLMGQLLGQGLLDDDAVRRTLGGMLVGSIDTTVSTFARVFCVAERDPGLEARILTRWRSGEPIFGLCLEALRRWPHNPILLRQTSAETILGGRTIPAGMRVVAWTQAAMQDPDAFPEPRRMVPDRPVAAYLHFGAGLHPCAGRAINAIQIPALLGLLLETGARRSGKLGWAGPFPDSLPVKRQFRSKEI